MQLRIFTEPQQGATYQQLLAVARTAEDCGFDGFFRSDHFLADLKFPVGGPGGEPGSSDAWVTLGALAVQTSTIRLGTLMTAATFRLPGPLAIAVAGVDQMSSGRVELGLGTGWFKEEHAAFGIPFPSVTSRFDRLQEQLEVISGLWETAPGESFSYTGKHYRLDRAPALPRPVQQPRPPIIIGGSGPRRTPSLAARFAAEFNIPYASLAEAAAQFDRVRAACRAAGRDPASIVLSAALVICCGRTDREVVRRAESLGWAVSHLRETGLAGSPAEVIDTAARWAEIGCERLYLSVLDLSDLDQLALVAEEVRPALAGR
jgi:F420-dependent oxidoreductase-like protein